MTFDEWAKTNGYTENMLFGRGTMRAAYEAGEIAMREKAAGFCNACTEILRPEDREGVKWIGRKIGELVLSGAAPEEKKS